jgi:hypothetical protein
MKLLDDNVLAEVADEIKAPGESGEEEDKDFLNSLEDMVKKVEDDPRSID